MGFRFYLSCWLLLSSFFSLSAQDCQAAFTFGETGITVDFFDQSTSATGDPITAWSWDFEEGTSNQQNPTFTFPDPDKYDVCLTITTQSGCTSTQCIEIETCVLQTNVSVGDCDGNNEIPITINISDPYDAAQDINISIDGVLVGGSPFRIRDDEPVVINTTVAGDGLVHTVVVASEDVGTCMTTVEFAVPDCTSDCFLSSMSLTTSGGTTHTVDVGDDFFSPENLTITVGDIVDFIWIGDGHSTTSDVTSGPDSWNSGVIGFGSTYEVSITNPGVHRYYCIPHGNPNGVGMSGILVANCPASGQFDLTVSFATSVANAAGYEILLDGAVAYQGNYSGTGPQSTTINIAGDGQTHELTVRDINDPSCTISRNYLAPDCGAAPSCSLSVVAQETGGCDANDQVPVDLTVSAINAGANGFSVLVDGSNAGSFNYAAGGTTTISINVAGDGQNHTISVQDNADSNCSGTTNISTTNCAIPCTFSNLAATTGSTTTHTVEVRDFDFFPRDITITAGDLVEWVWTGAIDHTATSDATSGPDSWDSGLLGTGATYTSPQLSAGLHQYYCIPHGAPNGIGMAGTITVQADCTNGEVAVSLEFSAQGGGFNGYQILVDGNVAASGNYDPSGQNSTSVLVPGDGQNHTISIRDLDDPNCSASTSVTTPDCFAPTCALNLSAQENGGCDANDEVAVQLTVSDVGGGANGFQVFVDGNANGTFAYSGSGTTVVDVAIAGDGQNHTILVQDVDAPDCSASTDITTSDCGIPCSLSNLQLAVAGGPSIVHTVEVRDFDFEPRDISVSLGDTVRFVWTGVIPHTTTSDISSGIDSWDSDLLEQGAIYDVVIQTEGYHPYYCIPHGAPGNIGMAGSIEVLPACDGNQATVSLSFDAVGSSDSYDVWVDGQLYPGGPFFYTGSTTTQLISLTGDGLSHLIQVADNEEENCFVQDVIGLPDCGPGTDPCSLTLATEVIGECDGNGEVDVQFTVGSTNTGSGFHVFLDGNIITQSPVPYALSGTTTYTLQLSGTGTSRNIEIVDADTPNCSTTSTLELPDCNVICLVTDLTVQGGTAAHTILVEDFVFSPAELNVNVGDTVRFVWTGVIPHTATSDLNTGASSWDSGLLGQGSTYEIVIQEEGNHPYYCIPHGGPGGIGMAGQIVATNGCENGQALVNVSFEVSNGSSLGYLVFVDGNYAAGPLAYDNPSGTNNTQIGLEGDGLSHIVTVQDLEVAFCAASASFLAPDCPDICLINNFSVAASSEVTHIVAVEDFVFEPSYLQARVGETVRFVWTGQIPHTATSDASMGPNSWDSGLLGQGAVYDLVLTEAGLFPYYCTPHGGPGGIGMAGVIDVLPLCTDSLATFLLNFEVSNGSPQGYRVFVGGQQQAGSPFPYDDPNGMNQLALLYPSEGETLVFTIQDMETPFCASTQTAIGPDCSPTCSLSITPIGEWNCLGAEAKISLELVTEAASTAGYFLTIDGISQSNNPTPYLGDTSILSITIPNDGFPHTIVITDAEDDNCSFTQILQADCESDCELLIGDIDLAGSRRYEVLVRDFDFLPLQLNVVVGDTVQFVWIGEIPHTATSDATTGPDVFNSGTLGNGASYEIVIQSAGDHPYYCIPHGAPGGVGMAGNITARDLCDDGILVVETSILAAFPSGDSLRVLLDNEPFLTLPYTANSTQNLSFPLVADGSSYLLSFLDNQNENCRVDTLFQMPDCNDECFGIEANFNYELTSTPLTYQFQSISHSDVVSWEWTFGDNTTDSGSNPLHTFPATGTYEVCLTVNNSDLSCPDTFCQSLVIEDSFCDAAFTYYTQDALTVNFTDVSQTNGTISNWLWGFGDGNTSTEQDPTYTYETDGLYQVCLLIQDTLSNCNSVYCEELVVGTVGVQDLHKSRELLIFPNPSHRSTPQWTLEGWQAADLGQELDLVLMDAQGRRLLQRQLTISQRVTLRLDDGLPAGVYLLQLRGEQGTYIGKLVVQ